MATNVAVFLRPGETFDSLQKRFHKRCESEGVLKEMKLHEHFIAIPQRNRAKRKAQILKNESFRP